MHGIKGNNRHIYICVYVMMLSELNQNMCEAHPQSASQPPPPPPPPLEFNTDCWLGVRFDPLSSSINLNPPLDMFCFPEKGTEEEKKEKEIVVVRAGSGR
jgi:hypothetical protein